jgi:hypothetical protein
VGQVRKIEGKMSSRLTGEGHLQKNRGERWHKRETQRVEDRSISDSYTGTRDISDKKTWYAGAHAPSPRHLQPRHTRSPFPSMINFKAGRGPKYPQPEHVCRGSKVRRDSKCVNIRGAENIRSPIQQGCREIQKRQHKKLVPIGCGTH